MNISRNEIAKQYFKVKQRGWLPAFQRESQRAGTSTAHLLAIGSRETNLENIRGDFRGGIYHGAGVLQVDIGTDPDYVRNWTKDKWERSVVRGVDIYLSKVDDTLKCQGRRAKARQREFTGKRVESDDLRRIATAAYNCGRWAHYHFSNGNNVDSSTTGRDYSRDVYDRAYEFARLLQADKAEPFAVSEEIVLQGKYARDRHKSESGVFYAERVKLPPALPETEPPAVPADLPTELPTEKPAFESPQDPASSEPPPASEAVPAETLSVEDWKPFVFRWLKRVWTGVSGVNVAQGSTMFYSAMQDKENWWIYALIAVGVFLLVLVAAGGVSLVLLYIWKHNRTEIEGYLKMAKAAAIDPNLRDLTLEFEKK